MATPLVRQQNVTINLLPDSPNKVTIPIQTPAGVAINASSGYSLAGFFLGPASNANVGGPFVTASSKGTFTFGNGSLVWDLTDAESQELANLCPSLAMSGHLKISNDAGDTACRLAAVSLRVDQ